MAINIKTAEDIAGLRVAGRLASELLDYLTPFVKPGVTLAVNVKSFVLSTSASSIGAVPQAACPRQGRRRSRSARRSGSPSPRPSPARPRRRH